MSFTLLFMSEVKPHLIADEVWQPTIENLQDRFGPGQTKAIVRSGVFCLDMGGAMLKDAVWVPVDLGRLTLEVPARDVEYFFRCLCEAPQRVGGAYKLHGRLHAVVLTTEQRRRLLVTWGQDLEKWISVAKAETQELERRLARAQLGAEKAVDPSEMN